MNVVNISVSKLPANAYLFIDGKPINLEGKRGINQTASYQTENGIIEITVKKLSEMSDKLWFFWGILFFLISFLGIFNPRYDRRCVTVEYTQKFQLYPQNNIHLEFNRVIAGKPAVNVRFSCLAYRETANVYGVDKQAKKRFRILSAVEALIWLAVLGGCAYGIIKLIIG